MGKVFISATHEVEVITRTLDRTAEWLRVRTLPNKLLVGYYTCPDQVRAVIGDDAYGALVEVS